MGACCENKPFGEPCGDCAHAESAANGCSGLHAFGCAFCGGTPPADPMSAALQWAVRMQAGDSAGFGGTAQLMEHVISAPAVRREGVAPTVRDLHLMFEINEELGVRAGVAFRGGDFSTVTQDTSKNGTPVRDSGGGGGDNSVPRTRPTKRFERRADQAWIEVYTPGKSDEDLGYRMSFKYCDLPAESWMYQRVVFSQIGTEMVPFRQRGEQTDKTIIIDEVFWVDKDGCTMFDHHSSVARVYESDNSKPGSRCLLCDFVVEREAKIYRDAEVEISAKVRTDGTPRPDWTRDDPDHNQGWSEGDFHILRYRRDGTGCLFQKEPIDWTNPHVKLKSKGEFVDQWEMIFSWAVPCSPRREPKDPRSPDDPKPREPKDPDPRMQPPLASPTGRPTVVTTPGFAPEGRLLRPGTKGWVPFQGRWTGEGRNPAFESDGPQPSREDGKR